MAIVRSCVCSHPAKRLVGRPPHPPDTCGLNEEAEPPYMLSFAGGARHRSPNSVLPPDGPRAVGAGAALWGIPDERGVRPCVAQLTLSAPNLSCSMMAEAVGLRAAIALATHVLRRPAHIGIVGDNLPVLRLAAANGRVRTPGIWETLEAPLLHVSFNGWKYLWTVVRRAYNTTADALARHA